MATRPSDHNVTERVADKAHETIDRAAERAGRAEESVRERYSDAGGRVREKARHGQRRAGDTLATLGSYIRENPLAATGLAFAVGALYSSLRRHR